MNVLLSRLISDLIFPPLGEGPRGLQLAARSDEEEFVKLLLHPGGALFMLAALGLLVWLVAPSLPVLGGFIKFAAFVTMIFGIAGGIFLTFMVNKAEAP